MKKHVESQGENTNIELLEDEVYVMNSEGKLERVEVLDDVEND